MLREPAVVEFKATHMTKKYALRAELLDRNPQLKPSLWKRVLVGPIVMGALLRDSDWRRVRIGYYGSPILVAILGFNAFYTPDMSTLKQTLTLALAIFFAAGIPLYHATAYGYKHRSEIDTAGGVDVDLSWMKLFWPLFAYIGFAVSSGVGIFSWFKLN